MHFWGLEARHARRVDVAPGTGWWTDIIALYLARSGGHYIAAMADLDDPKTGEGARKARASFEAKYGADPKLYGDVRHGLASGPHFRRRLASASARSTWCWWSREIHDWAQVDGFTAKAFGDFRAALEAPAGILAVEDHRAPDEPGTFEEGQRLHLAGLGDRREAKSAGVFTLAARPPRSTPIRRSHQGLPVRRSWTLPPTRRSAAPGQPPNLAFDHAKYDAIGESDRMTLKFVKA